jgi:uncharacterized membrane protein YphA (DoxX/SURF4 family)
VIAIVALRLGIGLHFYHEGATKLQDPKPFSAGFLGNAKGPLAPYYKRMVWDADGLYRLNYDATARHWDDYRNRVVAHYGFDEKQSAETKATLDNYLRRYIYLLNDKEADLKQYYDELKRRDEYAKIPSRSLASLQTHDARIAEDRNKLVQPVLATVDKMNVGLEKDLNALATTEQYHQHGRLELDKVGRRPFDSAFMDRWIPYFDLAVGVCLILGLFTRVAAIAGGLFLLSVCLSQWPWADGAIPIYYQAIEMLAMFLLAAIGAGQFAGIDFLISSVRYWCCPPKSQPAQGVKR